SLDELATRDRLVLLLAEGNLPDARVVFLVQQIETDGFAARGAEQPDRERYEPEREMAFPNASRHAELSRVNFGRSNSGTGYIIPKFRAASRLTPQKPNLGIM